jgi:tellurite methyltransferase
MSDLIVGGAVEIMIVYATKAQPGYPGPPVSEDRLDTAHETWDRWWREAKERAHWSDPEPAVVEFIPALQDRGARRVLDVGAGIGRHALAYARAGLEVVATDASATGIDEILRAARSEGLEVEARVAPFIALPLEDASVDHVLVWNVIYHGDGSVVAAALDECRRVLRPTGTLQLTMLSKRHRAYGVGTEVRPGTFVDPTSTGDKEHPHFYVDGMGLTALLATAGFEVVSMADVDQQPRGGFHWVVVAETVERAAPRIGQ